MTDLAAKLQEYGLEPDNYNTEKSAFWEMGEMQVVIYDDAAHGYPDVHIWRFAMHEKHSEAGFFYPLDREIKTDSDWRAVANFIKFIKGE